jgi:hypothetical protein
MNVLFPCSPLRRTAIDPSFADEFAMAGEAGIACGLYSHEALIGEASGRVLTTRPDPNSGPETLLRGWMMTGEQYGAWHRAMVEDGLHPVTNPEAYAEAHYLPLFYRHLDGHTPRSAWIEGDDPEAAWQLYGQFAAADALIKDWVKSAKHRWTEACFIPAGTDRSRFLEIFESFREARGRLFNRGVVLREFVPLVQHGNDLRGQPVVEEHRLFFWQGELLARPVDAGTANPMREGERWHRLARRFASPFITLDVAQLQDGRWTVVEAGDGGVSGLPGSIDAREFFRRLVVSTG